MRHWKSLNFLRFQFRKIFIFFACLPAVALAKAGFEPDVTITDIFIVIECVYCAYQFYKHRFNHELYFWFFVYFASIASTAFWGAIFHGAGFNNSLTTGAYWVWHFVLLSGGFSGLSFWMLGKSLYVPHARVSIVVKMVMIAACLIAVLTGTESFFLVTVACLPGLVLFIYELIRLKTDGYMWCVSSLLVMLFASFLQYTQVSIHEHYLTYNAVCHVVLIISYMMLFYGGQRLARQCTNLKN